MKAQPSPKKKSDLRLRLAVHHLSHTGAPIPDARLRRVVRRALRVSGRRGAVAVSLAFVSAADIRRLNRRYAGHDYVTDVLSFPALEHPQRFRAPPSRELFLGDVVICWPQAVRQANAAGQPLPREVDWLLTHGVLHLLGYDHATAREERQMRELERKVLQS